MLIFFVKFNTFGFGGLVRLTGDLWLESLVRGALSSFP